MGRDVLRFVFSNGLSFSIPLVLSLCAKNGLFDRLGSGGWVSVEELSRERFWDPDGLSRVLELLSMMGVVDVEDGKVRLRPELLEHFTSGPPFSILGMLNNIVDFFVPSWMGLFERMEGKGSLPDLSPRFYVGLSRALFSVNREEAGKLRNIVGFSPPKVLDVGAGSCVWSLPFAASGSRVWALDYGDVIEEVARPIIERLGLLEMYTFIKGDMWDVPWGGPYDLALAANMIHGLGPEERGRFLSMVGGSLRTGGTLVVVDFLKDGRSISPYIFDLHMYVMSGGKVFSIKEIVELVQGSGFCDVRVEPLKADRGFYAVISRKK